MPWECLARDKELASDLVGACTFEPLARPPCGPEVVRIRGKLFSLSIDLYSLKSQSNCSRGLTPAQIPHLNSVRGHLADTRRLRRREQHCIFSPSARRSPERLIQRDPQHPSRLCSQIVGKIRQLDCEA
jgi:hypothetical protein